MTCFFDFEGQITLSSYAAGLLAWKRLFSGKSAWTALAWLLYFTARASPSTFFHSDFTSRRNAGKPTRAPLSCVTVLFLSTFTFQYLNGVVAGSAVKRKGRPALAHGHLEQSSCETAE